MRAYELMIIVDGDHDDAMVDSVSARVESGVSDVGGRIASTDKWGKRRFAYEINHKHEGHYVVHEIVIDSGDLSAVERMLRLADEVVRHKLMRLPDAEAERRGLFGGAEAATSS